MSKNVKDITVCDYRNCVISYCLHLFTRSLLRWRVKASMPTRRRCICAVAHGKFIYVIGGHDGSSILNTVERYDTTR